MIESISYLNIKPLYRYRGSESGQTTITSFDTLLQNEAETTTGNMTVSENPSGVDSSSFNSSATNASASLFKDPETGKQVEYVDVSEDPDRILDTDTSKTSSAKKTTDASSMKKTKYDAYFKEAARKYGVSESLLKGIAKAESNFNPNDVSSAGAAGIMQLMPSTAKSLGVTDVFDPRQNILGGAKCIKQKLKEFNGNVRLALAAYNAGSGAVKRAGGVPSYCKTYVNRVLSYKEAFETASAVG